MAIIKHKEQRVGVLIDVQNMYHSAKNLFKAKVNFDKVLKQAVAGRKLVRAIAYVVRTEGGEEETFFKALIRLGIETKIKDLKVYYGGLKKGDWDVGMTIDAVRLANGLDAIVLVTGDGDFVPLVEYLKNQGRQVEVIAFSKSTSTELRESADDFVDLGEESKKYLI